MPSIAVESHAPAMYWTVRPEGRLHAEGPYSPRCTAARSAQALVSASRTAAPEESVHSLQPIGVDIGRHGQPVHWAVERPRWGSSSPAASADSPCGRLVCGCRRRINPGERGLSCKIPMLCHTTPKGLPGAHEIMADFSDLPGKQWRLEGGGLDSRYVPGLKRRVGRTPRSRSPRLLWPALQSRRCPPSSRPLESARPTCRRPALYDMQ
jgi:hypothetical protein